MPACSDARREASELARSLSAGAEQLRTARANAALACGQPPPPEDTALLPYRSRWGQVQRPARPMPVAPDYRLDSNRLPLWAHRPAPQKPIPMR